MKIFQKKMGFLKPIFSSRISRSSQPKGLNPNLPERSMLLILQERSDNSNRFGLPTKPGVVCAP
jgi:hypothetical protein